MKASTARRLYFSLQRLRGEPIAAALRDVLNTEFLSTDELCSIQAGRQIDQLRWVIRHVPYYRARFEPWADEIERSRDYGDVVRLMQRLPLLDKRQVIQERGSIQADTSGSGRLETYPDRTSGSTGTPLIFPCDQRAWAYRHALMFRCMRAFGVEIGEPQAVFLGMHWNERKRLATKLRDRTLNRLRVSAFEINQDTVVSSTSALDQYRPTHIVGYPSAVHDFCCLLRDADRDLRDLGLKAIFLTAEPLREHQRALIEETTGSRCVDTYGSAECGLIAAECPAGRLHVQVEACWLQLRPKDALHGDTDGAVVATDFWLRAFPMIRYLLGDEVRVGAGSCPCGRAHPTLEAVEGRSGDHIVLADGRRLSPQLPNYIFKNLGDGAIRRFRFVQSPSALVLYLVVGDSFNESHSETVRRETKAAFGDDVEISIELVDALPELPNAKHRDFVRLER